MGNRVKFINSFLLLLENKGFFLAVYTTYIYRLNINEYVNHFSPLVHSRTELLTHSWPLIIKWNTQSRIKDFYSNLLVSMDIKSRGR